MTLVFPEKTVFVVPITLHDNLVDLIESHSFL